MTKRFLTHPSHIFFVTLYLVTFFSAMAQDVQFNWAIGMGGVGNDGARAISTDAVENVYTIGYFAGTVDFDPGTGSFNLTSNFQDLFISKLDVNGNFVWAKGINSTSSIIGHSIIVDVAGNVYITGDFAGTVDFDPGTSTYNLTSAGNSDIFVSKLDANGNFVWAKSMGGIDDDYPRSLAVDVDGNVYIVVKSKSH